MARLGPTDGLSHVSTDVCPSQSDFIKTNNVRDITILISYFHQVVGTMGYAAPEYLQTGHLTYKTDVWSYGVFIYELITGRRALDRHKPRSEQKLLEWVRPHLSDPKKFRLIIDPRLEGKYTLKSVQKLAIIANRCLVKNPKSRPKMSEVVEMIHRILDPSIGNNITPRSPLKISPSEEIIDLINKSNKRDNSDRWFSTLWRPKLLRTC